MRILFCNIAWMRYYKGVCEDDMPVNGGSFVKENNAAEEDINFMPICNEEEGEEFCYGFVETKRTKGDTHNQLHIEKLEGCELLKNEESAEDVLVVFCARPDRGNEKTSTLVVGWYKHATVYRRHQELTVDYDDGYSEDRIYNIITEKKNAVLLPVEQRNRVALWRVPRAREGVKYGFGQANVWFPSSSPLAPEHEFITKIVKRINEYDGDNWVDKIDFEQ